MSPRSVGKTAIVTTMADEIDERDPLDPSPPRRERFAGGEPQEQHGPHQPDRWRPRARGQRDERRAARDVVAQQVLADGPERLHPREPDRDEDPPDVVPGLLREDQEARHDERDDDEEEAERLAAFDGGAGGGGVDELEHDDEHEVRDVADRGDPHPPTSPLVGHDAIPSSSDHGGRRQVVLRDEADGARALEGLAVVPRLPGRGEDDPRGRAVAREPPGDLEPVDVRAAGCRAGPRPARAGRSARAPTRRPRPPPPRRDPWPSSSRRAKVRKPVVVVHDHDRAGHASASSPGLVPGASGLSLGAREAGLRIAPPAGPAPRRR